MPEPLFTVRFTGGEDLARLLRDLPAAASRKVQLAALREAAEPMRDFMRTNAPIGPGRREFHLYESMTISVVRDSEGEAGDVSVAVGPAQSAFWGFFQEFGYGPGPAQPFARPAFETHKGGALTTIGQALWHALRQAIPPMSESVGGQFT